VRQSAAEEKPGRSATEAVHIHTAARPGRTRRAIQPIFTTWTRAARPWGLVTTQVRQTRPHSRTSGGGAGPAQARGRTRPHGNRPWPPAAACSTDGANWPQLSSCRRIALSGLALLRYSATFKRMPVTKPAGRGAAGTTCGLHQICGDHLVDASSPRALSHYDIVVFVVAISLLWPAMAVLAHAKMHGMEIYRDNLLLDGGLVGGQCASVVLGTLINTIVGMMTLGSRSTRCRPRSRARGALPSRSTIIHRIWKLPRPASLHNK